MIAFCLIFFANQRNFESCPEALPDIDQSLTEQYLLIRAANESFLDNKGNMDRKERCEREYDFGYKNALFEARQVVKNISIHVVKDFGHLCSLDLHDALQWFIYYVGSFISLNSDINPH